MKKAVRIFLVLAGVFVLLAAIALIAAFQPSVQTWLARKVASAQPGYDITIERVDAGLNKVHITGVRVKGSGLAVELPSATVDMSLLGVIREKVDIKKIVAKGWTLDLSQPAAPTTAPTGSTPAPAAAPAQTAKTSAANKAGGFDGLFQMLKLPVDLSIGDADIAGTIILPAETPGGPPTRGAVTIKGGQLRPGNDGRFDLALDAAIPGADSPVSSMQILSNLVVRMGAPREIQSLVFEADAQAAGSQFPQGARLRINVSGSKNASGEDYVVSIKSRTAAANTEKNLFKIKATNPAGSEGLNAMWTVDLRDADLAPFTAGLRIKLPAFTANGQGTFTADDNRSSFHAAGKFTAEASNLEVLAPALSALGRMTFSADFDVMNEGDLLRIGVLSADISSAAPVATIKTLQLIEINTATGEIKVPNLQSDLIRVDIHGIPLAWAQPFIKDTGLAIAGDPLRGSFTGRPQGNGYAIRNADPVTLTRLAVSQGGSQLLKDIDLSTGFTAEYSNTAWNFTVTDMSVRSNGATLLSSPAIRAGGPLPAPAKGEPKITAAGKLRAGVPAILSQPVAAGMSALSAGTADIEFSGNIKDTLTAIAAKITSGDLRAGDKTLPEISADLRADIHDNGACEVEAPLVFAVNGRKSDINLGATLKPGGARQNLDACATSNEIYIEDLMLLAAALPPGNDAPATTPAPRPGTTGAPWDGIDGQLKFLLKKVVHSPDIQVTDIAGSVKISPSLLSLENMRALMSDGAEMKADGAVKYDARTPAGAYTTDARLTLTNFDPGPFLKAANPGKKPTVEGKFDITGTVSGAAPTLDKIASSTIAELTLTNRGGTFNGFGASAQSSNIEQLQKTTSALGAIGGAVLSIMGKSDNSPALDKVKAGMRILDRLASFNFDQINLDATYRPGHEIQIKNFGLLSPDMRISGAGTLGNIPALSILKQALTMNLQMAVRGDQAADLRSLNILKNEADSLGYTPLLKDFVVDGTLASLGATALVRQVTAALATK